MAFVSLLSLSYRISWMQRTCVWCAHAGMLRRWKSFKSEMALTAQHVHEIKLTLLIVQLVVSHSFTLRFTTHWKMDMPCHAMVAQAVAEMHHVLIASIVSSSSSIIPFYVKIDSIVISALSTFTLCHTIQHIIHHFRMYKRIQIRPNQIRKKENSFLSVIGRSSLLTHAHAKTHFQTLWSEPK